MSQNLFSNIKTEATTSMEEKNIIRDPVHGFITFDDWEKEIIHHPAFQRLRNIRQLSLASMVYPGAMHTRFEHSIGVMHVATQMFDNIVKRNKLYLEDPFGFDAAALDRSRKLVRLSALLHDIGHCPFSHAGEKDLFPFKPDSDQERYEHEDYSTAIIKIIMHDVINAHPNNHLQITVDEVAGMISGETKHISRNLFWRHLISGQIDADRSDYLLRDSLHSGAGYGNYDLERLLVTITVSPDIDDYPIVCFRKGGYHVAEALILARYFMFSQVYFQKTVSIYGYHLMEAMKVLLKKDENAPCTNDEGTFLPPDSENNLMGLFT